VALVVRLTSKVMEQTEQTVYDTVAIMPMVQDLQEVHLLLI
jgi:hypothetical protein